ncbi:MAG: hypothetical protein IT384_18475 [Deltaproteobacteria bacterium]|nr:hypothetical protein [Deltaproteobacteria bacterium]
MTRLPGARLAALGAAFAVGASGCGREELSLALPERSTTWIVASRHEDRASWSLTAGGGDATIRFLGHGLPLQLIAAAYPQPLEALGLADGPLDTGVPDRPCELARPSQVFSTRLTSLDSEVAWSNAGVDLPAAVEAALLPDFESRCTPQCASVQGHLLDFELPIAVSFATRTASGAVAGLALGQLVAVDLDETVRPICQFNPPRLLRAGRARGDRLWLGFDDGALAELDLSGQESATPCRLSRTSTAPVAGAITALAVSPEPEPLEIFALIDSGDPRAQITLARFDGIQWAPSSTTTSVESGAIGWRQVEWIDRGTAIAAFDSDRVLSIAPDQSHMAFVQVQAAAIVAAKAQSFALDDQGQLWSGVDNVGVTRFTFPDRWALVAKELGYKRIRDLIPWGDRIFFGTRLGQLGELLPAAEEYCPPSSPINLDLPGTASTEWDHAVRLDERRILFAHRFALDSLGNAIVRRMAIVEISVPDLAR